MFKPACILQAAVVLTVLGGCASTQTAAIPALETPDSIISSAQDEVRIRSNNAPPIKAGISVNNSSGFVNDSGQLNPNIQAYANEVAQSRSIPLPYVEAILKQAQYNATVAKLMAPGKTRIRRSWVTYRNRFVEPIRIKAGIQFWQEHRSILDKTAADYGVPQSIIVAIIGVETVYGRQTGNFLVLDALATLGFRYPDPARPERSQLFRDQLADLIQLDYQHELNAREIRGSFAGAIGLPQFMPGSLLRYAADGDNDKHIDLRFSVADSIASVANFLRLHGWQPGLPVLAPVVLPTNASQLVKGGLEPTYSWAQLKEQGAKEKPKSAPTTWKAYRLGVVDLLDEPRNTAEYRTGTPNFFAITHYNRSYFYAASVADLAQALADQLGYGAPN